MELNELLTQIGTLRETKGKEKETYSLIEKTKEIAKTSKDYSALTKLYWEESLVAQHEVMNEYTKSITEQNKANIKQALERMENSALHANEIIEKHKLEKMRGTSYRFLGNVYRYKKDYERAEKEFIKALEEYQKYNDKGTLEIKGFIAYCLVQNKDVHNGIKLAIETFDSFETSDKGKELKEKDYVTWAIWRSGIIPRLVEALIETKAIFEEKVIRSYLDKSEDILRNPQGKITWGDSVFQLRLDEIERAKDLLNI